MPATARKTAAPHSKVLEFPPQEPAAAESHALMMLSHYTDPSDLHADLEARCDTFIVLDARSRDTYARGHIPGAINFPYREMDAESVKRLPRNQLIVTYCDGIGCNGSTKAALKLAHFGFRVKELIGGFDWWVRDGYQVMRGEDAKAGPDCGC
jgi:rhodanese-related sulfurtransferase